MIKIGDFAKICNVSTQTLRYYDTVGVLKADIIDSSNGYRFYSLDAIEKYKQILFYKELGFSLSEIKAIKFANKDQLNTILQNRKQVLAESIKKFDSQIKIIDDICENDSKNILLSDVFLLPFENDPQVVGKWRLCGKLINKNKLTTTEDGIPEEADKEITFMPGGAVGWKYFWTKGMVYRISPKYNFAIPNTYDTVEHNKTNYMIIQFMSNDCIDNGGDNIPLLYQQVDCMQYTEKQMRLKVDRTDIPFIEDKHVCGVWTVIDFVADISEFNSETEKCNAGVFHIKQIQFLSRGVCIRTLQTKSKKCDYTLRYTKGFVLDDKQMTAEEYEIKTINDRDYLFIQHKSGDYCYAGIKPYWYVFERKEI